MIKKIILLFISSICLLVAPVYAATEAIATFAMGCFWCAQADFDKVKGVTNTIVGYTGGTEQNPSYQQVSHGDTGHYEAIQVYYDPAIVSYSQLLDYFWRHIDPLNAEGQFCDTGNQYRAVIFYHSEEQKKLAEASKEKLMQETGFAKIATEILPAATFYPAEDYHQSYYKKKGILYNIYRYSCGRDARLKQLWN